MFSAAWRGSLSGAADFNLETRQKYTYAMKAMQPVRPKLPKKLYAFGEDAEKIEKLDLSLSQGRSVEMVKKSNFFHISLHPP